MEGILKTCCKVSTAWKVIHAVVSTTFQVWRYSGEQETKITVLMELIFLVMENNKQIKYKNYESFSTNCGGEGSAGAGRRADGSGRAGSRAGAAAIACATFLQSWVSALGRPGGRTPRHGAPEPALRGKPLRQWEGLEGEVYIKERKICKCGTK